MLLEIQKYFFCVEMKNKMFISRVNNIEIYKRKVPELNIKRAVHLDSPPVSLTNRLSSEN